MIKRVMLFVLLFTVMAFAGPDSVRVGRLTVTMIHFDKNKGVVLVALCDSEENYDEDGQPFRAGRAEIKDGKAVVIFNHVPYGEYAVKVFHDENSNEKLDTNWMGIPKEAFGFSNDAKGTFGPPDFDDAKFRLKSLELSIKIKLDRI